MEETDVLVLGAGVAGLAAAGALGGRATVLEREADPGGLVRTECFDGYWFDRVLHLLYFPDQATQDHVVSLMGDALVPCPPSAWVDSVAGTARFPLQLHLGGLEPAVAIKCVADFVEAQAGHDGIGPADYEEMLVRTFGRTLCEIFFLPYNRKLWKRPLGSLAPSGFHWNIAQPTLTQLLEGLVAGTTTRSYNADGWYPRPGPDAPVRGMECLAAALADRVSDLRVGHRVEAIDPRRRTVTVSCDGREVRFRYRRCCCTLPLPSVLRMCGAPPELQVKWSSLRSNRVLSAAFSVRGPRPRGRGHWRYYPDESLVFTRLVYLHEFDADCAPPEGWGLMAEITELAEAPPGDPAALLTRAEADIRRVGAVPDDCRIVDANLMVADPAYVVFSAGGEQSIDRARAFLRGHGIEPLGRYGRWEYSSMGQVIRDGLAWGREIAAHSPGAAAAGLVGTERRAR